MNARRIISSPGQIPRPVSLSTTLPSRSARHRIYLLSPANASGRRANLVLGESARCSLALRLRNDGLPLGEVFSFISGLYFRGKLTYARAHANPPRGVPGIVVITASGGLVSPDKLVGLRELREITSGNVDANDPRYCVPLERAAQLLCRRMGTDCDVVLLGSIATAKYVEPLLKIFGDRLLFPEAFVGRGDMSRGGLLLRCARENVQLAYVSAAKTVRHGKRPPKLKNDKTHFATANGPVAS